MTREEVYRDIEEEFGFVPSFIKAVPDGVLENDWRNMKFLDLEEKGALSLKERNLIGLAVSGVIKCQYCTLFHTVSAKEYGATDEEISEALRYAGDTVSWSTLLNGLHVDYEQFKDEVHKIMEFRKKKVQQPEKMAI